MVKSSTALPDNDRVVKTLCKMCYLQCGIDVYVKDGKIVKVSGMVEHPLNQGEICIKAEQAIDYVYSEDRLKYPVKKENGQWKQISWDEALDTIVAKLRKAKEKFGDSSLIYIYGDPTGMVGPCGALLGQRFCDVYGTPYRSGVDSICYVIRGKAALCTVGKFNSPDAENANCIILWGHNPHNSLFAFARLIDNAMANGAKLIVIDPRRTVFAKRADIHIQPRPGTDCALGLAILNTIISEGLYDKEFVAKWTHGFDELAERVKEYPPEEVERITWVPAETIREIARMFAANKPACIVQGTNTLDQQASGFQNSRIILILQAITGNIDIPGGSIRVSGAVRMSPTRLMEKVQSLKLMGAEEYPVAYGMGGMVFGEAQSMEWPDVVLSGKPRISVGIVQGANPVVTWPNSNKVRQALEKLELLVVMDLFMTATTEMADIVLPASSFFETTEISHSASRLANAPYVIMRKQVIEPLWESWPDWKFWFELAKRMGYEEYFPWKGLDEYLDYLMKPMEPTGITINKLTQENPEGVVYGAKEYGEYQEKAFRTPTGKVELYSEMLKELGYDPLPYYTENPESPISAPELAKEYPLILTSGARMKEFWHSMFRQLPELSRKAPEALAEIHPDTAREYGVSDGDMMVVETTRGKMEIRAKATEDIMRGVVCIPHGWAKSNVNLLTDNKHADPISGYPALKGELCRIKKA
jgi:anaerobic selenocysteine-containing dehydrogenase